MKIDDVKLTNISYDFAQKGTKFVFFCYGDKTNSLEEYLGLKVNMELKGDRRSLSANRLSLETIRRITREVKDTERRYIQAVHI